MSLLNEVLQDLDQRAPPEARRPVRLAAAPASDDFADDFDQRVRPDWLRLTGWTLVGAGLLWAAWVFIVIPEPRPVVAVQPAQSAIRSAEPAKPVPAKPEPEPAPVAPMVASDGPREAPPGPQATVNPAVALPAAAVEADPGPPVVASNEPVPDEPTDYLPLRNVVVPPPAAAGARPVRAAPSTAGGIKTRSAADTDPLGGVRRAIGGGELAEAEVLLQQRLRLVPADLEARELLIGLMLRGERLAAAMVQLDEGLGHHPRHAKFSLIKARLLAQQGDTAAALSVLAAVPRTRANRVEVLQMLGALYQQQHDYDRAVESYRALLAVNPAAGPAWVGLAIGLDGRGDDAGEALQAYRRALELGGLPGAAEHYARLRVAELERNNG